MKIPLGFLGDYPKGVNGFTVRGERFDNPQGSGNPHLYPQLIFVK